LLKRIQIAQAEKKDWKKEPNVYLASYRSLPHPTTGMSPADLLFGRKIPTRLPELRDIHVELEVRDHYNHYITNKGKMYAHKRRNARYSDILPGDKVLVQQMRQNKLSSRFNPVPFTVVKKHGNSLVVHSKEGVQYSRNTSHCETFLDDFEGGCRPEIDIDLLELPTSAESIDIQHTSNETDSLQDPVPTQEETTCEEVPHHTTIREEVPLHKDRRVSNEGGTIGQASDTLKKNIPLRRSERIKKKPIYLNDYA
jgi:hypothetical protein